MGRKSLDILETAPVKVPRFSTGQVAKILDLPIWRLQKFLDSPRYDLSPSGQLGKGRGSRRTYSTEDVYRIGIAAFLIRDGFAPKFVGSVLQFIEDRDLIDVDEDGIVSPIGIVFKRGKTRPKLGFFPSGKPPKMKVGGSAYYALDLGDVTHGIDRQIDTLIGKKRGR